MRPSSARETLVEVDTGKETPPTVRIGLASAGQTFLSRYYLVYELLRRTLFIAQRNRKKSSAFIAPTLPRTGETRWIRGVKRSRLLQSPTGEERRPMGPWEEENWVPDSLQRFFSLVSPTAKCRVRRGRRMKIPRQRSRRLFLHRPVSCSVPQYFLSEIF